MDLNQYAELVINHIPDPNWAKRATCRGSDHTIFFPVGQGGEPYVKARELCEACPVKIDCLIPELPEAVSFGMRGGLTPDERSKLKRKIASMRKRLERVK